MIYGYARVSTDGQSVAAQIKELRAAGAEKIFRETASGAKSDRAQLRRALAVLDADDVLLVTRLDRLARSTRDLLNTLAQIAAKGARFRSLADTWAAYSDGSRRACRVRARLDPYTDGRRPRPRQGAGREARPQTDLDAAPEGGGDPAQGAPQGDNRADCAEL
jgi:Resolvase, N terminal domain